MSLLEKFYAGLGGLGELTLHAVSDVSTKYQEVLQGRTFIPPSMPTDTISIQTSEATPEVPFYTALAHYQALHENHVHHEGLTSGQGNLVPE